MKILLLTTLALVTACVTNDTTSDDTDCGPMPVLTVEDNLKLVSNTDTTVTVSMDTYWDVRLYIDASQAWMHCKNGD